jgi:hypothetical protein
VSPIVTIYNHDPALVTPGYFFISPYQQVQDTPHIYDNDGVSPRFRLLRRWLIDARRTSFGLDSALLAQAFHMRRRYATTAESPISASTRAPSSSGGPTATASSWTSTIAL